MEVLAWQHSLTQRYGSVRAALEGQGRRLADLDLLIAVQALEIDAVLVTNDQAFHRVDGLSIEDWTQ
nr:PIN domain-containing protein [Halomonas ilicicola]